MAKLNIPQAYDKAQLDGKVLEGLEGFIDFVNQNMSQLINALTNQLTFGDNLLGSLVTISVMHRTPIVLPKATKAVSAIIPLRCAGGSIRSFSYFFNQDGSVSISFVFDDAVPIQTKNATVSAPYVQYQTKYPIQPGDRVSISAYGNQALNKNVVALEVSSTVPQYITAYTSDSLAASETKNAYTGDAEVAKSITLFIAN